jgi:hypothetical protein
MRILLLHPQDSPRRGPWSRERWDLIVDLGKSSAYSQDIWSKQFQCPILRMDSFRDAIADAKLVRKIFSRGDGCLVDEEGIDWWKLTSLLVMQDALEILAFQRAAGEIGQSVDLWSTRPGWPANAFALLLHRPLHSFGSDRLTGWAATAGHYAGVLRRFSLAQIEEIFFDKYDPGFEWRSRFAQRLSKCASPVVLLPSAYGNASRAAAEYARMLPQQSFLMVATRENAKQFTPPPNISVRDLASYARPNISVGETSSLMTGWTRLRSELCDSPDFQLLAVAGILDAMPGWLRSGISTRNAWREVIEREPVVGVLCADDSNRYTRLPVLLAAKRKIPTVDFHHGALDGRYLFKEMACDVYLAKNEMERDYLVHVCGLDEARIVLGPAESGGSSAAAKNEESRQSIILFSEPYEAAGMRGEEFYRELLPPLLRLAQSNRRDLIIKLHPFESITERKRLVRDILGSEAGFVTLLDGPLTAALMSKAWCGITIESTTVLDCWQNGICCFLCGWVTFSPFGYAEQYARFGVGEVLQSAAEIAHIPSRLEAFHKRASSNRITATPVDSGRLQEWLTSRFREPSRARSVS